jgi:hypothetical protein
MNRLSAAILFRARRLATRWHQPQQPNVPVPNLSGQAAADLITAGLRSGEPFLAARFGSGELEAIATYLRQTAASEWPGQKCVAFILGKIGTFWWHNGIRHSLSNGAGVFSVDNQSLDRFSQRMLADSTFIDVLGSWREEEHLLTGIMPQAARVPLKDLEPYFNPNPWSEWLRDRRVLVVHPFAESISRQYEKRRYLFRDPRVLPEFQLLTYKPLQTIAGNKDARFATWFDALHWMEQEIVALDFEIAIVGCGGYGLPLSASIKRMGKQVIHLGGATQLLFGIRGRRWDTQPQFQALFNTHWIWPSKQERPKGAEDVEGGCYW